MLLCKQTQGNHFALFLVIFFPILRLDLSFISFLHAFLPRAFLPSFRLFSVLSRAWRTSVTPFSRALSLVRVRVKLCCASLPRASLTSEERVGTSSFPSEPCVSFWFQSVIATDDACFVCFRVLSCPSFWLLWPFPTWIPLLQVDVG